MDYFNALGSFSDAHTLQLTTDTGGKVYTNYSPRIIVHYHDWLQSFITAENIVIAVGGRPRIPDTVRSSSASV